jgi:signal transduction histidine kinase
MVEQKVAELRQAQSLAAIGQMVSVVAHEVRNPLQSIKLGTDVLHLELDDNKSLSETLAAIDRGIETLSSIVTELLEYSKPVELQYSTLPVMALVEEALRLLSHKLRDISISLEVDQREREISVDSMKFTAVLVNLISNAIEAMPNGGSLGICSRFLTENGSSVLKLSITDNGCGIAEKDLQRVQEPFVTTKSRGTGLGLPICKKIVEAHRGSMQIRSRLNEGTVVEITIPSQARSAPGGARNSSGNKS